MDCMLLYIFHARQKLLFSTSFIPLSIVISNNNMSSFCFNFPVENNDADICKDDVGNTLHTFIIR